MRRRTRDSEQAAARRPNEAQRAEFERLLEPLLRPLYQTALGFVNDPNEAEDVVGETVARAYAAYGEFQRGTNFKAWLFRILTNYCINRFRRKERGPQSLAYEDVEREAELVGSLQQSSEFKPAEALVDELFEERVEQALRDLPAEFRAVLLLSDVQELSYKEIADILDIPVGTVRSRLFRARRWMRARLADYAREHGLASAAEDPPAAEWREVDPGPSTTRRR